MAVTKFNDYTRSRYIPVLDGRLSLSYLEHTTNVSSYQDYANQDHIAEL